MAVRILEKQPQILILTYEENCYVILGDIVIFHKKLWIGHRQRLFSITFVRFAEYVLFICEYIGVCCLLEKLVAEN